MVHHHYMDLFHFIKIKVIFVLKRVKFVLEKNFDRVSQIMKNY